MNIFYKWIKGVARSSKSNFDAAIYFMFVWFMLNLAFYFAEHVIFGDDFIHIGDIFLAIFIAHSYTFVCMERNNENSNRG